MRLLRAFFRRRRGADSNQHIFGRRNFYNQFIRGTVVSKPEPVLRYVNLPGETNRQFAERMRAEIRKLQS